MKVRIVERTDGNGSRYFVVQEKSFFWWVDCRGVNQFFSAETAERYIINQINPSVVTKEKVVKEFDL